MQLGLSELIGIATLLTLVIGFGTQLVKMGIGQGKAKARESNFVEEVKALKEKDVKFEDDISDMKTDISAIKINQEIKHSDLKQGIGNLEITILKELRKQNGRS